MNIFSLLKKDHMEAKKLMKQITRTDESEDIERKNLFHEFNKALTTHSKVEEDVVYSAMKMADDYNARLLTFENFEEHHILENLINKLTNMKPSEERWTAAINVLQEMLEAHIKEEESVFFVQMKKDLSKDDLDRMAEEFVAERDKLIGGFESERKDYVEEPSVGMSH